MTEKWMAKAREIVSSEPNLNRAARMANAIFAAQAEAYAAGEKAERERQMGTATTSRARGASHD